MQAVQGAGFRGYMGLYGVILGLYRDSGKGNGNNYLGFRVYYTVQVMHRDSTCFLLKGSRYRYNVAQGFLLRYSGA